MLLDQLTPTAHGRTGTTVLEPLKQRCTTNTTPMIHPHKIQHNSTCENVMEDVTFFILEANINDETISLAFEHIGVTMKDI